MTKTRYYPPDVYDALELAILTGVIASVHPFELTRLAKDMAMTEGQWLHLMVKAYANDLRVHVTPPQK